MNHECNKNIFSEYSLSRYFKMIPSLIEIPNCETLLKYIKYTYSIYCASRTRYILFLMSGGSTFHVMSSITFCLMVHKSQEKILSLRTKSALNGGHFSYIMYGNNAAKHSALFFTAHIPVTEAIISTSII